PPAPGRGDWTDFTLANTNGRCSMLWSCGLSGRLSKSFGATAFLLRGSYGAGGAGAACPAWRRGIDCEYVRQRSSPDNGCHNIGAALDPGGFRSSGDRHGLDELCSVLDRFRSRGCYNTKKQDHARSCQQSILAKHWNWVRDCAVGGCLQPTNCVDI